MLFHLKIQEEHAQVEPYLNARKDFFNNKSECTFGKENVDFCMNLSNRERALLVADKRVCWSRSVFDDVNDWVDCKGELMCYNAKHCVKTKAHEREKIRMYDSNKQSNEHVEADENDDSS